MDLGKGLIPDGKRTVFFLVALHKILSSRVYLSALTSSRLTTMITNSNSVDLLNSSLIRILLHNLASRQCRIPVASEQHLLAFTPYGNADNADDIGPHSPSSMDSFGVSRQEEILGSAAEIYG